MNVFFETEHLVVREFEPEDAIRLYENHAEEKVKKWFPNESYTDINEAEDAIRFFIKCVIIYEGDNFKPSFMSLPLLKKSCLMSDFLICLFLLLLLYFCKLYLRHI